MGLVLVLGALVAVLSQRDTRLAGTNSLVQFSGKALPVPPGDRRCASDQLIPDDTAAVRLYAGTFGRPRGEPFVVSVDKDGRQVTSGRTSGDFGDNSVVRVPLPRVESDVRGARVCIHNLGDRRLQFAANLTPQIGPIPGGTDVIRTDWLLAGEPTWWDVAPRVVRRATVFKPAFVGAWTFWFLVAVVATTWVAGLTLILRRAGE
ncbi:MAG: hypothetical protein M3141_02395 [Actinomycetota bacterium]|nr:hypothetical protein [Actinomycetota bacterium]